MRLQIDPGLAHQSCLSISAAPSAPTVGACRPPGPSWRLWASPSASDAGQLSVRTWSTAACRRRTKSTFRDTAATGTQGVGGHQDLPTGGQQLHTVRPGCHRERWSGSHPRRAATPVAVCSPWLVSTGRSHWSYPLRLTIPGIRLTHYATSQRSDGASSHRPGVRARLPRDSGTLRGSLWATSGPGRTSRLPSLRAACGISHRRGGPTQMRYSASLP